MTQAPVNDPYEAENQGNSKLNSYSEEAGTGSPQNRKPSPERQKEQSLGVHRDPYAASKRKR
jgi:hypothetical protein